MWPWPPKRFVIARSHALQACDSRSDHLLNDIQYLLPKLVIQACTSLESKANKLTDSDAILEVIRIITFGPSLSQLLRIADKLKVRHRGLLLRNPTYRQNLEDRKDLMWQHLDEFNIADDVAKMFVGKCTRCRKIRFVEVGTKTYCERSSGYQGCGFSQDKAECWVSREQAAKLNQL